VAGVQPPVAAVMMLAVCLPLEAEAVSCQTKMKIAIFSGLGAGSDLQEVLETGKLVVAMELQGVFGFAVKGMLPLAVQECFGAKAPIALELFAPPQEAQTMIAEKRKKRMRIAAVMPPSARTVALQAEQAVFVWQQALPRGDAATCCAGMFWGEGADCA